MKRARPLLLLVSLLVAPACGRPFVPAELPGFIELDEDRTSDYEYRATTADGVVVAIRTIKHRPRGELAFWERAIENQLRDRGGYALLEKRDVATHDGVVGRQLRFGHDEEREPHLYYVTIIPTRRRLFVIEAGGTREQLEASAPAIEAAVTHLQIRRCWRLGC